MDGVKLNIKTNYAVLRGFFARKSDSPLTEKEARTVLKILKENTLRKAAGPEEGLIVQKEEGSKEEAPGSKYEFVIEVASPKKVAGDVPSFAFVVDKE